MKYYKFYKTPNNVKFAYWIGMVVIIAFVSLLLCPVVSMFFIAILPEKIINLFPDVKFSIFIPFIPLDVIVFIIWCRKLIGVFLFDEHIEVKTYFGSVKISYENMISCEYVGNVYKDVDSRFHYRFGTNYYGGNTKECVKIKFSKGLLTKYIFFGTEHNTAFIKDLNSRIYKQEDNCESK